MDTAYGEEGADLMTGGSGNDRLRGGDGDDVIYGAQETGFMVTRATT